MSTKIVLSHDIFMRRAFDLARLAEGAAAPNPMVGAVLVYQNKIIGEGYFKAYGVDHAHAEVNAIGSVLPENQKYISKSDLYVSLEPCNFFGKTPPCTGLILRSKIPRVIISTIDKTPQVSGNGIELLRKNGVEVITKILEKEGDELVKYRTNFVQAASPFVILKYAKSKDGFLGQKNKSVWLTNPFSKRLVHKWRNEINAIMVGTNTARQDNPRLTNRLYFGKNPLRIVLDRTQQLSKDLHLFSDGNPTWYVTEKSRSGFSNKNITTHVLDFDESLLKNLLKKLHDAKIATLMVEGGAQLLQSFIDQNLWHEARVFESDHVLQNGILAPNIPSTNHKTFRIGNDTLTVFKTTSF